MITKRGILISTVGFGVGCPSTPTPRLVYHPLEVNSCSQFVDHYWCPKDSELVSHFGLRSLISLLGSLPPEGTHEREERE